MMNKTKNKTNDTWHKIIFSFVLKFILFIIISVFLFLPTLSILKYANNNKLVIATHIMFAIILALFIMSIYIVVKNYIIHKEKLLTFKKFNLNLFLKLLFINLIITGIAIFSAKFSEIIPLFKNLTTQNIFLAYTKLWKMQFFSIVILLPVSIEIIFRGAMYQRLKNKLSPGSAMIMVSVLYVIIPIIAFIISSASVVETIHIICLFINSIIYTKAYEKTQVLFSAIFLNMFTMFFYFLQLVFMPHIVILLLLITILLTALTYFIKCKLGKNK